jgi:outer membrane protein
MKNHLILAVMAVVVLMAMTSKGPATNIGLASATTILGKLPEAHQARAVLDTLKSEIDLQYQAKVKELREKQELYQTESASLNDIVKADKEAELLAMHERIVLFQESAGKAYREREAELMNPILKNLQTALDLVAEDEGFTHIFNTDASNGSALLLYAKDYARVDSLVVVKFEGNNND